MFKALIFDMDGLMVDTEPMYWQVGRQIAAARGKVCTDATLRKLMGRSRMDSVRIFATECGITDITPEEILVEREKLMLKRYAAGVEPMRGLHEILQRYRGRMKMAVATSSPKAFTDVLLPALGVADYFEVVQTGDDVKTGKPDPEIYLKAISRLKLEPAECIVLEDSPAGALAGHRAGAYVIAVPSPLTADEDFSFADARAADLLEAAAKIRSIEG